MKKWLRNRKLSQKLVLVSCVFLLAVTLLLWYTNQRSLDRTAIQAKEQEVQLRCSQVVTQVNRITELCNMSTQVFLNTPALVEHLSLLKAGQTPDSLALMDFYREDLASLEKIVISNPDLYQIRVYSTVDGINEMMPILYSSGRMQRMPWAKTAFTSGTWYLNFDEQLFDNYPVTRHVMSLLTSVDTSELGRVGVLEVSVRMDQLLPQLFETDGQSWALLLDAQGTMVAGSAPVDPAQLEELDDEGKSRRMRLDGKPVLVGQAWLKELNCRYVQITSLAEIETAAVRQAVWMLAASLAAFAVMAYVISRMTRRMLQGLYDIFDSIRAFADGNIDATVEVAGEGEVAAFAKEAGSLLDKIRQLMHDNLEREMQARNSEIRALQNQINAHFIYNVLEAIKMMAEIDGEFAIADAVTSLGKLLRYSMKWESGNVRLERELDYIQNYVALMNLRFDYVISLDLRMPPELLGLRLPKVSLQPIVENAVVHGAATLASDTTVSIWGELDRDHGLWRVHIADAGKGMDAAALARLRRQIAGEEPARSTSGNGIGLHNVQERIQRSFGGAYGLTVASQPNAGTTVTVTLPYYQEEEKQ